MELHIKVQIYKKIYFVQTEIILKLNPDHNIIIIAQVAEI